MCFALRFIRREVRDNHTLLPNLRRMPELTFLLTTWLRSLLLSVLSMVNKLILERFWCRE
jgi:hypothetical protein